MGVRNIHPDVASKRGVLAGLNRQKAPPEAIAKAKRELEEAKLLAQLEAIASNPPALSPEVFTTVVSAFAAAVVTNG